MARDYFRPELNKKDIELVLAGKCVMINPDENDVEKVLQKVEKKCRKNKLPLNDALRAWSKVVNGTATAAFAGEWKCPTRAAYEMQGTVFEVIRITDGLIGLLCERQTISPGMSSQAPIAVNEIWKRKYPAKWLNQVLNGFWTQLSDDELDALEKDMTLKVMENKTGCRKKILEILSRGVSPSFVSEFKSSCLDIAAQLRSIGMDSILWSDFKKSYPSIASRYQPEILNLMSGDKIHERDLQIIQNNSPYSIVLSFWDKSQRIFDEVQLVFLVRNLEIHREFQKRGGAHKNVSEQLKKIAKLPCHPGTANTIGWLRVHIDDENKLCFIDEVQSDTLEEAYKDGSPAAKEFLKACSDWHFHGFSTIYRWACDIGYRVGIHSRESAVCKEGMSRSERKWNTYYKPLIKRYKLRKAHFDNYPSEIWISE